jgi:hypothetical protein
MAKYDKEIMNFEIRRELYHYMIQREKGRMRRKITNALDILEKLDFTKEQYKDKDYLINQIDNIIEY